LRILTVIPYFSPAYYFGGPVRVTHEITRRLALRGHRVDVYTTDVFDGTSRHNKKEDNFEGVRVIYFRNIFNRLASRYHAFLPRGFYSSLRETCSGYDLIHIHEYYTFMAAVSAGLARKNGVPFLLSAHGSLPVTRERGNRGRKTLFNHLLRNTIVTDISRAIALNAREKEQYASIGIHEDKIEIIPNGINVMEFRDLPDGHQFRSRYGIRSEDKVILFVGRIHEIKGLDILLKAFNEVTRTASGVKLVIVGPDDGYLKTLYDIATTLRMRQDLVVTGLLSGGEKLSAYAAADIFVLPSRSEGFPVTVLEACASGLPVIITDRCNFSEVEKLGAGLEVTCSEQSLSNAIRKLLNDPALGKEMGGRGRKMVFDRYDWDSIVLQLEKVYRNVINRS
jgi:glycosyltransferase involved in cell wall biosynthesis